jgi:hypothetical protein
VKRNICFKSILAYKRMICKRFCKKVCLKADAKWKSAAKRRQNFFIPPFYPDLSGLG